MSSRVCADDKTTTLLGTSASTSATLHGYESPPSSPSDDELLKVDFDNHSTMSTLEPEAEDSEIFDLDSSVASSAVDSSKAKESQHASKPPGLLLPWYDFGSMSEHTLRAQGGWQSPPGPSSYDVHLQLKARELDAYATQLMAHAMHARAEVCRMQSELERPACPSPNCEYSQLLHVSDGSAAIPAVGIPPGLEKRTDFVAAETEEVAPSANDMPEEQRTTIMLRNLPNDYSRDMLMELLNDKGFESCYDFLYLPMDTKRKVGLGYAFLNLVSHTDALRAFDELSGLSSWKISGSAKVLTIAWGHPLQGLEAHMQRYRNSSVMHHSAPDELRPILLRDGKRIDFPPPTQKLRAPRLR